jgi:hypothetical protein
VFLDSVSRIDSTPQGRFISSYERAIVAKGLLAVEIAHNLAVEPHVADARGIVAN